MRIAIYGSRKEGELWPVRGSHSEFVDATKSLGRALAKLQHTIIVGSHRERAADLHVAEGFVEVAESVSGTRAAIEMIRPRPKSNTSERSEPNPYDALAARAGHLFRPHPETARWWHDAHLISLRAADAVLTIGGSKSTYAAGLAAIAARKPLVPIASFGGSSTELLDGLTQPSDNALAAKFHQLRLPWSPYVQELALDLTGASTAPRILIVHGRSLDWQDLKTWLEQSAGLRHVTVMAEEYGVGEALPEKFERLAGQVDGAIALATPDDFGSAHGEDPRARARQNVWLEVGWFWGRLGRKRVMLLTRGRPEIPTDLSGLEYLTYRERPSDLAESIKEFLLQVS